MIAHGQNALLKMIKRLVVLACLPFFICGCNSRDSESSNYNNLAEYLGLKREEVNLLRNPEEKGVLEHAQHVNFSGFDLFSSKNPSNLDQRIYIARDGKLLAILSPTPGVAEIYVEGRAPMAESSRVLLDYPNYITYAGNGFTVRDAGFDGPELIFENMSAEGLPMLYRMGGSVQIPVLPAEDCRRPMAGVPEVLCCRGKNGEETAFEHRIEAGWITREGSRACLHQ